MAHPESDLENADYLRGLKYALRLAFHIPDCSQARKLKDNQDYTEGFRDGCLNVAMAIALKLTELEKREMENSNHDKRTDDRPGS
jgi:hypothetical protein